MQSLHSELPEPLCQALRLNCLTSVAVMAVKSAHVLPRFAEAFLLGNFEELLASLLSFMLAPHLHLQAVLGPQAPHRRCGHGSCRRTEARSCVSAG